MLIIIRLSNLLGCEQGKMGAHSRQEIEPLSAFFLYHYSFNNESTTIFLQPLFVLDLLSSINQSIEKKIIDSVLT